MTRRRNMWPTLFCMMSVVTSLALRRDQRPSRWLNHLPLRPLLHALEYRRLSWASRKQGQCRNVSHVLHRSTRNIPSKRVFNMLNTKPKSVFNRKPPHSGGSSTRVRLSAARRAAATGAGRAVWLRPSSWLAPVSSLSQPLIPPTFVMYDHTIKSPVMAIQSSPRREVPLAPRKPYSIAAAHRGHSLRAESD
eukprot:scaffold138862_cov32-Tisochrysis_lutea.AAC.1